MGGEVKFTDEQWERVAMAAEDFAAVLKQERQALGDVLVTNWAGDCAEGTGTMENLRLLLQGAEPGSFSGAIGQELEYLQAVADQCRAARTDLTQTDVSSADDFRNDK
ncbi:UNVERIFIED_CONTAM: hypothetical protein DES50_109136 [Williamsia faeni]